MRTDALIGIQDMGAAGLTCSTCEMGSRGGAGIEIDVRRVPQRETGMTPYEIMLSRVAGADAVRRAARARGGGRAHLREVGSARGPHRSGDGRRVVCACATAMRSWPRFRTRALADDAPLYDRPRAPAGRPRRAPARQALESGAAGRGARRGRRAARAARLPQVASKRWVYPAVTITWCGRTRSRLQGWALAWSASRGPGGRWRSRWTATAATATSTRVRARGWRSPSRRATWPAREPSRWARRTA